MAVELYAVVAAVVYVTCTGPAVASPYHPAVPEDDHEPSHQQHRSYHFQYAVNDPHTGDVHSQNEVNDGHGTVKGTYSLVEPDGATRVVEYTADDEHGFNAEVKRIEPLDKPAAPVPTYEHHAPVLHDDKPQHHYQLPDELFS